MEAEPQHMHQDDPDDSYQYSELPRDTSFRVAELLPGTQEEQIICRLHPAEWPRRPLYDAISYAWGDPTDRKPIVCDDKHIYVTKNLYTALVHFRHPIRSRIIWADGLCINQGDIPERGKQVKQMKTIYENAQKVLIWLGSDNENKQAMTAVEAIHSISDFLCQKLNLSIWENHDEGDTYQEMVLKNRDKLPVPSDTPYDSDETWKALLWFYSHRYFTRVWAIQEVSANTRREVHVGNAITTWNRVDLVASYLAMDNGFWTSHGFSESKCWWVSTFAELVKSSQTWLNMLYLASNYGCLDPRDVIFGLRGLMSVDKGAGLLDPDYDKSTTEVYRDCVEAAFDNFGRTDVLAYAGRDNSPSWIPRWDKDMTFRNPFRFGKDVPWSAAGGTRAKYSIDRETNILHLDGNIVDEVARRHPYQQRWFLDNVIERGQGGEEDLSSRWNSILQMSLPYPDDDLIDETRLHDLAIGLSFGLDHKLVAPESKEIVDQFVAYLVSVQAVKYLPSELMTRSKNIDGRLFGKPVWDFDYPTSSVFATHSGLIGCAAAVVEAGDVVFVPCGSTYLLILQPHRSGDEENVHFKIRGFSYVSQIMNGEALVEPQSTLQIR